MTPEVVVDIGNSRMKWGLLREGAIAETISLGRYPSAEWQEHFDAWQIEPGSTWLIASVDPGRLDAFTRWLTERFQIPAELRSYRQIPMRLEVENPSGVGIDRLLASFCATNMRDVFPPPFLVVQVGTALVVNFVNAEGAFIGGAILPGFALMAKALNEHTAKLPHVSIGAMANFVPGKNTEQAIQLGMLAAALGTVRTLRETGGAPLPVFLTGGDAGVLLPHIQDPMVFVPDLVLEGLRLVGAKMP